MARDLPGSPGWPLVLLLALALCGCGSRDRLVIGSKNFTEQTVVAELVSQQIEARTGLPVERRFYLGGTYICHQALAAGRIDAYVEYTGTALTAILKERPAGDRQAVYRRVREGYSRAFELDVFPPLGFNNTFAMVMRGDDARRAGVATLSEATQYAPGWRLGCGYEFLERPDGFNGLVRAYGLRFAATPRVMDLGLLYRALQERQVDVVAGNSTDGLISALGLTVLRDDRNYFPPYEAVPVVNRQALARFPALRGALEELAGKVSDDDIRRINYALDGEHRDVAGVVREFRVRKGL